MWSKIYLTSSFLTLFMQISLNEAGRRTTCGGIYTAARGILTTPNFPDQFNVPIKCQWVIDASNSITGNGSIIVYFTQLFVIEGLTFTEYQLYGNDYKINPKLIFKVNETNAIRTRWIQTYQSYLVIELKMQTAESAHLRVLDKFLDIYGFNITYEITTTNTVRNPSCTMMDCGFTGICYDHYTKFSCNCFDGYFGPNCSEGPKSFCYTNGTPTCKNGGTCLHVGVAAVKCHCSKLFTGNTCETSLESATNTKKNADCSNCSNCSGDGKLQKSCKCLGRKTDSNSGQTGFFATLHLGNLPSLEPNFLKEYLQSELLKHLRANVTKVDDVKIVNLIHYMAGGADATFQVFTPKRDEKKVKNVLNKWSDRGYVGNITVTEKDNSIKTPLSIQSVDINQSGLIRENDEFILSCVARGSPSMTFRWFKDGIYVNLTYTRHKWIKVIKDPHVSDQYTALLAVEKAQKYDEGKFTCQVEDFNIQQCMSKFVKVRRRPLVKIEPMTLTVRKGENFTVKCITLEGNGAKYSYSWTKNKELLPVKTEFEKYETLYPAGTILQVFRVEKDVTYSCLVQDSSTSSEKTIQINVLHRNGVYTCSNLKDFDRNWPETAPDTDYIQECPKTYFGTVSRHCILNDIRTPNWSIPDFSQCTSEELNEVNEKFNVLKLGYASSNLENIFNGIHGYLSKKVNLQPGEGARILTLLEEIFEFVEQIKINNQTMQNYLPKIFNILDFILSSPNALLNPKEINMLQTILLNNLRISGIYLAELESFKSFNMSLNTLDIAILKETPSQTTLYVHDGAASRKFGNRPQWDSSKLTFQRTEPNFKELFARIVYRNLSDFFPPKSFLRINDGSEIQYQIFSQIMSFVPISTNNNDLSFTISIKFQHKFSTEKINVTSNERWKVKCGYTDIKSIAYPTWNIDICKTINNDDDDHHSSTSCLCPKFGSYVLMLILTQHEEISVLNEPHKYILLCSFFLCIILTLFTSVCLGTSCILSKTSCIIILKLQCSLSIFFSEILFAIAILNEPPQRYMMIYLTFLEMFLLLAITSHLSKLLIVFTELIEIPKTMSSKYTVMGIISGVPLITIFGNHLAHKTMNIFVKSWWMSENSLAFNVFVTVISIITGLFIFIYFSIIKKLKELVVSREKQENGVKKRISLVKRSGCLFGVILGFIISSIIYVNNQKNLWSIYQFGGANVILSITLTICYIFKSETELKTMFRRKPKRDESFFSADSTDPLHFITKQEAAELENRQEIQQISLKSLEINTNKVVVSKTQSISNAFESCLQTSSNFCDGVKEVSALRKDKNQIADIQCYNISPPKIAKESASSSSTFHQSPDILTAKNCVGLDLVACLSKSTSSSGELPSINNNLPPPVLKTDKKPSSEHHKTVRIMFPPHDHQVIITPDEAISRILENETAAAAASSVQNERTQPDGHADIISISKETAAEGKTTAPNSKHVTFKDDDDDNLDGVLDSIHHDLDYLLNRNNEAATNMEVTSSSVTTHHLNRKVSKPPGANVINKIPEEINVNTEEVNSVLGSIMLRTNC